ncbi:MAG: tetratricopeptide repeat protein [Nitrospirales bacterium]
MYLLLIVFTVFLFEGLSHASPCSDFQWHYPAEIVEPELFKDAQHAMTSGQFIEASQLLALFLKEHPEGALAKGAKWALASLPDAGEPDPENQTMNIIEQLTNQRRQDPESPYVPWSLCRLGELNEEMGWSTEANGIYEEFLETYPKHRLAGGVLLNVGLSFLQANKNIEAALTFRQLVEGPKWGKYHVQGALGLANATALSQAWKQASYWYQVVEVEQPELIRASALSSYNYGLTESKLGHPHRAIDWLLTTYNLHPQKIESGRGLNEIGHYLSKMHQEMAALWFFHEAAYLYKSEEPGRRGELSMVRWVASYLATEHTRSEWESLYHRFDELEIYLSVSWDGVIESTRILAQSPEGDIADEAQFWLARGYQETEDSRSALQAFRQVLESSQHQQLREKAQVILTEILLKDFREYYERQAWVGLIRIYDEQKSLIKLLPYNLEWMRMIADAYRFIGLPRQAMHRYQELLTHDLAPKLKEDILWWNVLLANDLAEADLIRHAAAAYSHDHPQGSQRFEIAMILGQLDIREKHSQSAVKHFTQVLEQGKDKEIQRVARRERARAYQGLGKFDAAIADYRHLVKASSTSVGIRLSLGDLLYEQKRFTEAEVVYQSIAELESEPEAKMWARFRLAMCLQESGKAQAATDLLKDLRQPGQNIKDLELTIQSAAAAVIDEFIPAKRIS